MVTEELASQQRSLDRTQTRFNSIIEIGTVTAVSSNGAFATVEFGITPNIYTIENIRIPLQRHRYTNIPPTPPATIEYYLQLQTGDIVAVTATNATRTSLRFISVLLST